MRAREIEIVYGYHAVRQLLSQRSHDVLELRIAQNRRRSAKLDALCNLCEAARIPVQYMSPLKLDRLTEVKNHQGIVARCRPDSREKPVTLTALCAGHLNEVSIILVLDRLTDPHNLGACIRTADAAGVDAIVLPRNRSAPLNATVRKVASGAAEAANILPVANIARSLRQLRDAGCLIIGAAGDADETLYQIDLRFPVVLVMGSEEDGMRRNTRKHCDHTVRIPLYGVVGSLNVSVAAGVCLYEIRRQCQRR